MPHAEIHGKEPIIDTAPGGAGTIPKRLLKNMERFGDRVALREKRFGLWRDISWNQYGQNVRAIFFGMASLGARRGERICLISENRPEWLYLDLAIMSMGAITAAIYVTNAAEQVHYILDHCDARLFFVENEEQLDKVLEVRDKLPKLENIVVLDGDGLRNFKDPMVMFYEDFLALGAKTEKENPDLFDREIEKGKAEDIAFLVYTSGTTGPPKGAMLTHRNALWTSHSLGLSNPMYDTDEVLSFLPLCHIAERLMTTINQITFGYTVNFAENLETVPQNLREVSPTVFFAVPRIWEKFHSSVALTMERATFSKRFAYKISMAFGKKYAPKWIGQEKIPVHERLLNRFFHMAMFHPIKELLGLERIRFAISGAAPISPFILEYFHGLGLPLREVYGQTEGSGPTTIHHQDRIRPGTVGKAIPGAQIRIADDGEILIKGGNVFAGYYKNPDATAETVIDGWLYSGDVGKIDDGGYLRITDRKKDIIITAAGKNIAPQNIENQLNTSPYINDSVVIGDGRKFLTALILIDEENVIEYAQQNRIPFTTYQSLARSPETRKLIHKWFDEVNSRLARVEQIKKFTILDKRLDQEDGELTPTMKVKRKHINKIYKDVIEKMYKR
jgi:long-chain acyl-CoA synthetase